MDERILYEDNHLLIINKLPGEIVQVDKTGDRSLEEILKDYIAEKYNKPGQVFLAATHRLDRPVSGIVVFARTSKGVARMNELFRSRTIRKTYWALVRNTPPKESDTLIHYLKRNESKNMTTAFTEPASDRQQAELKYKVLARTDNYTLLEVDPLTGRHHQIRVQLSKIGCPIKGDIKYGDKRTNPDGSIHLHARRLEFIHPIKKELMTIIAAPPDEPLWNSVKNYK